MASRVAYLPVQTRRSKKEKGGAFLLRAFLAQNVVALRDSHRRYKELPNPTARNRALAKDADVSPSQVHRVIEAQLGASIDVVEALARALEVRPQDLLTPYFHHQPIEQLPAAPMVQEPRELRRSRGA
jgi:hypothetical protein